MIRRESERETKVRENLKGGPGNILLKDIVSKEEMFDRAKLYSQMIVKPHCGVGFHTHANEEEIYLITKGKGIYNDDGTEYEVGVGDVTVCEDGHGHGIINNTEEDLEVIALIIYK